MRGISQLDTSSSSSGGLHSHGRLDTACPSPARAVPVQEEDIHLYGAYTNNQGRSGGIAPISSCLVGSHRGFHPTASALVSAGLHNQPVPQDWSLPELPSSVSRAELLPSAGNAYTDLGSLQKRLAAVATVTRSTMGFGFICVESPSPGATSTPRVVVTRYLAALLPALYLFLA